MLVSSSPAASVQTAGPLVDGIHDGVTVSAPAILRATERADFHVSMHRMIDYVEIHALACVEPSSMLPAGA